VSAAALVGVMVVMVPMVDQAVDQVVIEDLVQHMD